MFEHSISRLISRGRSFLQILMAAFPCAAGASPVVERGVQGGEFIEEGGERERQGPPQVQAVEAHHAGVSDGHENPGEGA